MTPENWTKLLLVAIAIAVIIGILYSATKIRRKPARPLPSGSIGDVSVRIGYDVRDLYMAGYTTEEINGILNGEYSLEELLERGPLKPRAGDR